MIGKVKRVRESRLMSRFLGAEVTVIAAVTEDKTGNFYGTAGALGDVYQGGGY